MTENAMFWEVTQKILFTFGDSRMGFTVDEITHHKGWEESPRLWVFVMWDNGSFLYEDRDRWRVLAATAEDYRWIRNEPWDERDHLEVIRGDRGNDLTQQTQG